MNSLSFLTYSLSREEKERLHEERESYDQTQSGMEANALLKTRTNPLQWVASSSLRVRACSWRCTNSARISRAGQVRSISVEIRTFNIHSSSRIPIVSSKRNISIHNRLSGVEHYFMNYISRFIARGWLRIYSLNQNLNTSYQYSKITLASNQTTHLL